MSSVSEQSGVYEIVNRVNGKRYVGSAVCFGNRWKMHRSHLRRGLHHSKALQRSWNKYGETAFDFRAMLVCDRADVLMFEQRAFDVFKPEYNCCPNAKSCIGRPTSDETRAKMSAAKLGKKQSPEMIAARSAGMKGRKLSPQHVEKLRGNNGFLGRKHTDEWKAAAAERTRIRFTGVPKSSAHIAKMSAAFKGKPRPPRKPKEIA